MLVTILTILWAVAPLHVASPAALPKLDRVAAPGDGGRAIDVQSAKACAVAGDDGGCWTIGAAPARLPLGLFGDKPCSGSDDRAIVEVADVAAKALGADLVFPHGKTCTFKTGLRIDTPHTHWRGEGVTIKIPGATRPVENTHGVAGALVVSDTHDLVWDGLTFVGDGAATPACDASAGCKASARIVFQNVDDVVLTRTTFAHFGAAKSYTQGLLVIGGRTYLIHDSSAFLDNSGDGLAFTNGSRHVVIEGIRSVGNGDSAIVCTIGGSDFRIENNDVSSPTTNRSPIVVMDRCRDWTVTRNGISGGATGFAQGMRVARYADTTDVNQDFAVSDNRLSGVGGTAISVEGSAARQGAQGRADGGGRFEIAGNRIDGASGCILVADSENGRVHGNTCLGVSHDGIDLIAYSPGVATGAMNVFDNVVIGGAYGIRQLQAGGTITRSTFGGNRVVGQSLLATQFVPGAADDRSETRRR